MAEGDKTESGPKERFISLPLRQREEGPGEHLWSQCGHASDPSAFSGSGPSGWRPGGGGTVRQSGLCACKLGLLAPRFRHLPDGRQEWTGHLVDGVGLFLLILREDRQTNKTPCFRPDKLRKNKSPGLPRTWTHALSRRCSSPALRHHIPIQQQ